MQTTVLESAAAKTASDPTLRKHRFRWLFVLFKIALSAVMIAVALYAADLPKAWSRAANQDLWLLLVAALLVLVQLICGALRWHVILASLGARISVLPSLRLFYASVFFNTCFVGAVGGDVLRAWLSYRARIDAKTSVHSVLIDRVAALGGTAILVIATAPWFVSRVGAGLPALLPAVVALAGLVGIAIVANFDRMPLGWLGWRPLRLLQDLGASMRAIFLNPATAVRALSWAVAAQAAMALSAYAVAASLGIAVSAADCLLLMQPVALLTALPISIGGWGVRETAIIGLFGLIGVPAAAALVMSVQFGIVTMLVSLPGGILWLTLRQAGSSSQRLGNE